MLDIPHWIVYIVDISREDTATMFTPDTAQVVVNQTSRPGACPLAIFNQNREKGTWTIILNPLRRGERQQAGVSSAAAERYFNRQGFASRVVHRFTWEDFKIR